MKVTSVSFPEGSVLLDSKNDYSDSFSGFAQKDFPIEAAAFAFFNTSPRWIKSLLRLRNKIVRTMGLKVSKVPDDPEAVLRSVKWEKGEEIGLFKVYNKLNDEIILGQDDSHLDFRISLLKRQRKGGAELVITTTVVFNNLFGKIYFLPVKFFHKPIVKAMTKSIVKELSR